MATSCGLYCFPNRRGQTRWPRMWSALTVPSISFHGCGDGRGGEQQEHGVPRAEHDRPDIPASLRLLGFTTKDARLQGEGLRRASFLLPRPTWYPFTTAEKPGSLIRRRR
jgi:hypothetical protein